jgi:type II secretory pathway pseudopilin PulG
MAILAVFIVVGLKTARVKARDTQAKTDVWDLSQMLINYSASHNGQYPKSNDDGTGNYSCYEQIKSDSPTGIKLINSGLTNSVPASKNLKDAFYFYCSNGTNFQILTPLVGKPDYVYEGTQKKITERKINPSLEMNAIQVRSGDPGQSGQNIFIQTGDQAKIAWQSQDVAFCEPSGEDNEWEKASATQYSTGQYLSPALIDEVKYTYTLQCKTFSGKPEAQNISKSVTVDVLGMPSLSFQAQNAQNDIGNNITAYRTEYVKFSWASSNLTSCSGIGPDWSASPVKGKPWQNVANLKVNSTEYSDDYNIYMKEKTDLSIATFTLSCTNPLGGVKIQEVKINIKEPPAPSVNLTANNMPDKLEIDKGKYVTLRWSGTNLIGTTPCKVEYPWPNNSDLRASPGSNVTPALDEGTYTYKITCQGFGVQELKYDAV